MPPSLSMLLPPIHLLTYGTLLGTTCYQTFIVTKITFAALPRSAFTSLQKKLFPVYFQAQTLLAFMLVGTHPKWLGVNGGILNLSSWEAGILGAAMGLILLNAMHLGREVGRIMVERVHQETRDKVSSEKGNGEVAAEIMVGLNKTFRRVHALSLHVNLGVVIALVGYGVVLSGRMSW
ncbi:hypothetical protein BJ875DRAFT_154384 [Amylocarpus encephaloides]|uniref:TMEM205-like domain-containing protein n=1 Tax=Amylocarpus encephaloides TaxID=45428 RepID=A0A9P7YCH2_9HELO|nr:hypothetical protein BJ875DRAFT_154384 [Amylocarpus encephaloides]